MQQQSSISVLPRLFSSVRELPLTLQAKAADPATEWRKTPCPILQRPFENALSATRFKLATQGDQECTATNPDDCYTLAVNLSRGRTIAFRNGKQIFNGNTQPAMVHIAQPGDQLRAVFLKPVDSYQMVLPVPFISTLLEEDHGHECQLEINMANSHFPYDFPLHGLVRAAAENTSDGRPIDRLYADGLSMAIVSSVLYNYSNITSSQKATGRQRIRSWELKKIDQFVDDHIEERISLSELASLVGLSRMHFAYQFRQSTGQRPHEYVIRRRIGRSQQLLKRSSATVLDVALSVGFETQSHFSTVFKKVVGDSPAKWRSSRKW